MIKGGPWAGAGHAVELAYAEHVIAGIQVLMRLSSGPYRKVPNCSKATMPEGSRRNFSRTKGAQRLKGGTVVRH